MLSINRYPIKAVIETTIMYILSVCVLRSITHIIKNISNSIDRVTRHIRLSIYHPQKKDAHASRYNAMANNMLIKSKIAKSKRSFLFISSSLGVQPKILFYLHVMV